MQLLSCNREIAFCDPWEEFVGLGPLGKRRNNRRMGLIGGFGVKTLGRHVLELIEKPTPVVTHGTRIVKIRLVKLLDVRSVRTK